MNEEMCDKNQIEMPWYWNKPRNNMSQSSVADPPEDVYQRSDTHRMNGSRQEGGYVSGASCYPHLVCVNGCVSESLWDDWAVPIAGFAA
jgi:hypothetical protein